MARQTPFTQPVTDSVAKVNREVAVGEDLGFQRSWWRFERGVWGFFVLVLLLDIAGAFGRGPLAHAEIRSPDKSLDIHYERIERSGTPSIMTIELGAQTVRDGAARVFVSQNVIDSLGTRRVIPAPSSTVIGRGGLTYTFPASTAPASVQLEFEPAGAGIVPFEISVPGVSTLRGKIVVMP